MTKSKRRFGKSTLLASSISALALPMAVGWATPAVAQEVANDDEIIVTATRREVDIQDVPFNITAVGGNQIEQQGFNDLTELSTSVAGLHIVDQGGHAAHPIIVRGLNADPAGPNDGSNDGGGTVGTYVGEIPLFVDLRLEDMERVEVLMGPQGTLYGSGTLGGAIRYIPRLPQFGASTIEYRADVYGYSHSNDYSNDLGVTFNIPLGDMFALRASVDRLEDSGFVDYDFIVREPGVSDPDEFQTPSERATNLAPVEDANDEDVLSGRVALRFRPVDFFDSTLTYYFQNGTVGGRQIGARRGLIPVEDDYTATRRVREIFERNNELLAWENRLDLGFAELTSATGYSRYNDTTQRDQTDLLLLLQPAASSYYYDNFPTFTAFTHDTSNEDTFTQELRLVSQGDGPWSWLVGAFYSRHNEDGVSMEFTPHFSEDYLVPVAGADLRTDGLEYISVGTQELEEEGYFFETSYRFTPRWQVTLGGRWFSYDLRESLAVDLPLLNTSFFLQPDGDIVLDPEFSGQSDDGFLWKFNTSYDVTDDFMVYFTRSSGYRIGNSNGVEACSGGGGGQTVCAQPNELAYTSDTTINYEIGARTEWFDGRLTLNVAAYHINWQDPQVASATQIGAQPITINAGGAETNGFEINFNARLTDHWSVRGSYANNNTELTENAARLVTTSNSANNFMVPAGPSVASSDADCISDYSGLEYSDPSSPFNGLCIGSPLSNYRVNGVTGDRLPGSPQHQASLFVSYTRPVGDMEFEFNYGVSGISEVLSRTGGRGFGQTLDSYLVHNASMVLSGDNWRATLYANNLFDEYYETGVVSTNQSNVTFTDDGPGTVFVRSHYNDVGPPRQVGVRLSYRFGD